MTNESGLLSGEDVLLVIEALEAYIRYGRDPAPHERQDYHEFDRLRARLKLNLDMEWSASAQWWLSGVLRTERQGLCAELLHRFLPLLQSTQPLTRGRFRREFTEALKELADTRFYEPRASDRVR